MHQSSKKLVAETNKHAVARSKQILQNHEWKQKKSCHSSPENILIEHSTVLFLTALSMYNPQQRNATAIATAFRQTNFTKTKASRINLQREIKKTRGLTVQFSPTLPKQRCNSGRPFCAWSLPRGVWTIVLLSTTPSFFAYLREISMSGNGFLSLNTTGLLIAQPIRTHHWW